MREDLVGRYYYTVEQLRGQLHVDFFAFLERAGDPTPGSFERRCVGGQ